MIPKKALSIILIFFVTFVFAQSRTQEIGLVTDNDLYTSSKNDKYYTNGLELFYRFLSENKNEKVKKKITEFRLGQYIYNPHTINADDIALNDRPFAGYLFAGVGRNTFYQNESVLKVDFQLGFIGKNSFGQEMQEQFHKFFKYRAVHGWQHQIQNALAIQAHLLYSTKLFPKANYDYIDFNFQSEANLGTIFTGVKAGWMTRIGFKKLVPIYDSNLHGASMNANPALKQSEFYFYAIPSINCQVYDATIQGSLFNDNSPVTYNLIPLRFNAEAGLKYRKNSLNLSYAFVYRSKELKHKDNMGYFYGSIQVSYLLK